MLKTEVLLLGQKQATVKWGPVAALSTSGGVLSTAHALAHANPCLPGKDYS